MRVMGLDLGSTTIGVAVSDPLGLTAQGVEVIRRTDQETDLNRLEELSRQYEVQGVVIGMPRNMNGTYGPAADYVRSFAQALATKLALPIYEEDERLTTVVAEKTLLQANLSRRRRRQVIDKIAACLILESFLTRKSKSD